MVGGPAASGTAVLSGSGFVQGAVNVAAAGGGFAGVLNPGSVGGVGTLQTGSTAIAGSLVLDFDAVLSDKLVVAGNFDISAGTLALNALTSLAVPSYTLVSYTGALTGTNFAQTSGVPSGYNVVFDTANQRIKLVSTSGYTVLSATATASSSLGSTPALATDGDFNTRWIAAVDTSTTKSSLTLDLGSAQTANRFSFIAYQYGRSYKLESSTNGTTWTTINASFAYVPGSGINTLREMFTIFFQPVSARYFRLTSNTSIAGQSMSVWEAQLINDSAAAPVLSRLASLKTAVQAYNDTTEAGKMKRAVLDVTLEQTDATLAVGDLATTTLLLDDLDTGLAANAAQMAAPATGLTNLSVLYPLHQHTVANNPYLKRLADGTALALLQTDPPWPRNTPNYDPLGDLNVAREMADEGEAWFWMFAHPDSPYRHNAEVLRRVLRRAFAAADSFTLHGAGYGSGIMDVFANGTMSVVMREFQALYPGLLLPNQNAAWNSGCQVSGDAVWSVNQNNSGGYPNINVGNAAALHNYGTQRGDAAMVAKAQQLIQAIIDNNQLYPDGAVSYIWTQNEAGGYQGTVESFVNRYYRMTGYAPALAILQGMEWYGPINGKFFDWWTSPSWKHMWNSISGTGQTGEATNGKNPYTRADLDSAINAAATASNWIGQQNKVAWYEPGTVALTRPDYTVFDRNVLGPRAWYGHWNYVATVRPINDTEPGHHTIMGCQVMDSPSSTTFNASVMGVFSRIRTAAGGARDVDGTFAEGNFAWLTSKLAGDSTVGDGFSAVAVSHKIHNFGSSSKGTERDWTVRQIWLNLSDRIVGLQDITPNTTQSAYEVQGAIRLGFGGTAYTSTKTLIANGSNSWTYGNFAIKIHGSNYAEVVPEVYEFRRVQAPITEITLRDQIGGGANTTANTYTSGSTWKFIGEVRPTTTTQDVVVTELAPPGGLVGIEVYNPTTAGRHRVVFNPGTTAVDYTPDISWRVHAYLHHSAATKFRPDWVPAPTGPLPGTEITSPSTVISIPAKANIVIEQGPPPANPPTVTITSPAANLATLTGSSAMRVTATLAGDEVAGFAWSTVSGPAGAVFADPAAADTTATFPVAGTYVLQCVATNPIGSGTATRIVSANASPTLTYRQGDNGYPHIATFIRGDSPTRNSGIRDQMIVGKTTAGSRGILAFDLVPALATWTVQSGTLTLTTHRTEAGSGSVGTVQLHKLFAAPVEGIGDGNSDASGAGTGATWNSRDGQTTAGHLWTTAGGDFDSTILSSVTGFSGSQLGAKKLFTTGTAFVAAAQAAVSAGQSLNLIVRAPTTESSGSTNQYIRFASDDATNLADRPLLTLVFAGNNLPVIAPGTSPVAVATIPAALSGTATNATGSTWAKLSGPGAVSFENAAAPATTAAFSAPGAYVLSLSGSNANGEISRTLPVTVVSNLDSWRQAWFGTLLNSGTAADDADPNKDGENNLLEFATGQNPNAATSKPGVLVKNGTDLEFTYTRSLAAMRDGFVFTVEYSDSLAAGSWSSSDVNQAMVPGSDNGTTQLWEATVPAGSGPKRFVRMKAYKQ